MRIKKPFAPGAPKPPTTGVKANIAEQVGKYIQPQITVQVKGLAPMIVAPYGKPKPTAWKVHAGLAVGTLGVLGYFIARGMLKR
jgi:hypothetical protein